MGRHGEGVAGGEVNLKTRLLHALMVITLHGALALGRGLSWFLTEDEKATLPGRFAS